MTVYVDDMRRWARIGNSKPQPWSHLMADTTEELLEFAKKLGLKTEWIQHPGSYREHFDVAENKRLKALKLGAQEMQYAGEEHKAFLKKKKYGLL